MIKDITDTITAYTQSFQLASRYKLYPYLMLSGIVSLIIGVSIFGLAYILADDIGGFVTGWYPFDKGSDFFYKFSNVLSGIVIAVGGVFIYKYIILIAVAPIMSPLSEKLEEGLSGVSDGVKFSTSRFLKEIFRGIGVGLRNIFKEIFYTVLLLIAGFIPGIAIISTPGIYFVQSYYAGFGNMDYFLERHYGVKESARFVRRYKGIAVANGAMFLLMLLIPVIGLFLAPFLSTIAATKVSYDRMVDDTEYFA